MLFRWPDGDAWAFFERIDMKNLTIKVLCVECGTMLAIGESTTDKNEYIIYTTNCTCNTSPVVCTNKQIPSHKGMERAKQFAKMIPIMADVFFNDEE